MDITDITHGSITVRLIAAAVELQQYTKTAANLVPLPGTSRVIAVGTPADIARLLEIAPAQPVAASAAGQDAEQALQKTFAERLYGSSPDIDQRRDALYTMALIFAAAETDSAREATFEDMFKEFCAVPRMSIFDGLTRHTGAEIATNYTFETEEFFEVDAVERLLATQSAKQGAQHVAAALADYVLMPKRLTAENGAKGALSGEFKETISVTCHECDGSGEDEEFNSACVECNGAGTLYQDVPVGWDTIKDIYKAAVALLAAPVTQVAQDCVPVAEVRDQALTEAVKALFWKFEKGAAPFKVGYSLKQLEKDDREVSVEPGDMYSIFEAAGLIKSTTNKSEG